MASLEDVKRLKRTAAEVRWHIVNMMGPQKAHHFGGSLSAADIVTALYFYKMRYKPQDPLWPERDRFIMSKGHSVPAQYAALALLGVLPVEELATLKHMESRLQGHPAMHETPGLEACTGALGEGLSYANGMALAARVRGLEYRVYCLLGDGELHEGQIWEAAMTASCRCLDNVVAIIDRNRLKGMDSCDGCKTITPLPERWVSFGWAVTEIDGHDMAEICSALDWADLQTEQPTVIIAHTVKGRGVSFIEGEAGFHNSAITVEQFQRALDELETARSPR